MTTLEQIKKAVEKAENPDNGLSFKEAKALREYTQTDTWGALNLAFLLGFTGGQKAAENSSDIGKGKTNSKEEQARKQAIERLCKLSPEALDCVLKPIEWAYNWYDGHDMDSLSMEELERFQLLTFAIGASKENFQTVYKWRLYYQHKELEERQKGAKRT